MREDLARAQWVKVIAGRGNILTREAFAPLWSGTISPASVQILLPDPDTPNDSWLDRRSHNVARFDPGFTPDLLRSQVRANVDYLTQAAQTHTGIWLRRYNLPHTCRIIATDKVAYLTFYSDNAHGRNSPASTHAHPGFSTPSPSNSSTPHGRTAPRPPTRSIPSITSDLGAHGRAADKVCARDYAGTASLFGAEQGRTRWLRHEGPALLARTRRRPRLAPRRAQPIRRAAQLEQPCQSLPTLTSERPVRAETHRHGTGGTLLCP